MTDFDPKKTIEENLSVLLDEIGSRHGAEYVETFKRNASLLSQDADSDGERRRIRDQFMQVVRADLIEGL